MIKVPHKLDFHTFRLSTIYCYTMGDKSTDSPAAKKLKVGNETADSLATTSKQTSEKTEKNYGELDEKLEGDSYNLFFNKINSDNVTDDNCITFQDLLSLGPLKEVLHITYSVDRCWLNSQYSSIPVPKVNVWCEAEYPEMDISSSISSITHIKIREEENFPKRTHHSKITLFYYKDNEIRKKFMRIVVMTANLNSDDWETCNQGIWISPKCPLSPPNKHVEQQQFGKTLSTYMSHYDDNNLLEISGNSRNFQTLLNKWMRRIEKADFSKIKVILIASVTGKYASTDESECNSHHVITQALLDYDTVSEKNWPIFAQVPIIGKLWADKEILSHLFPSLKTVERKQQEHDPDLWIIYPSEDNFRQRILPQSDCLIYDRNNHQHNSPKIADKLVAWSANRTNRTRIMPHIKSYCRVSDDKRKLSWFLLTSKNLTKNAWGYPYYSKRIVSNYEMGVLFLPKKFGDSYFAITDTNDRVRKFPFMYDVDHVPPQNYGEPHLTSLQNSL